MLTVVSYNIHECVGTDGQRDPERIARIIQEFNADIVGLQEVDFSPLGEKKSYQLNYISAWTGLRAIAAPTIRRIDAEFGNALLTRPEIHTLQLHDVSFPGRQPRGVIDAVIAFEDKTVRVLVTHLGLHARERKHQVQRLLKILNQNQGTDCTILLGDINEWRPQGFAVRMFNAKLGRGISARTFPSFYPVFALDRVWVSPRAALVEKTIPHHRLARIASDHLPVRTIIDLSKASRQKGSELSLV
jgi:endonuclease/exonuclease/phosphatase family metal-dependent hydrolase